MKPDTISQPDPFYEKDSVKVCLFRGVAQLVEHRSPKPGATGSIPVTPATKRAKIGYKEKF